LESNVKKTLIDSVIKIKQQKTHIRFLADSVSIQIIEKIVDLKGKLIDTIPWLPNITCDSFWIDTNFVTKNIWAKFSFENSNPSLRFYKYYHVDQIQIILDSIPVSGGLLLTGEYGKSSNWSLLGLRLKGDSLMDSVQSFTGSFSPLKLSFYEDIRKPDYGWIKARLSSIVQPSNAYSYTVVDSVNLYIGYKTK